MEAALRDFILLFVSILYQAMPFVVLGAVIAGIVEELSPHQAFAFVAALASGALAWFLSPLNYLEEIPRWLNIPVALVVASIIGYLLLQTKRMVDGFLGILGQHRYLAIAMSGLLGLVIPMCECGIIPVTRRLLRKGLPLSCCVAYILTGPIINIVVLLSTYVAFENYEAAEMGRAWMVVMRSGMAYLVAIVTALVVERLYRTHGDDLLTPLAKPKAAGNADEEPDASEMQVPLKKRVGNITETSLHDFTDITVFLILGSLFAAFARMLLTNEDIDQLSEGFPIVAILAMMALSVLLCLCSEADAFVAASFSTLPPAAKLSFLVLGPMMDIKLYLMYQTMFRPRLIWTIIGSVVLQVFVYSVIVHYVWQWYMVPWLETVPSSG